jgi:adenylyltransferase/sulfurtransferase
MPLDDEISADELKTLMAGDGAQLLDVRSSLERLFGAIRPSAHVPLGALETPDAGALLAKQGLRPDKRTVVYCAGGVRSLKALKILRERHGFARAQSLRGGMKAWREA